MSMKHCKECGSEISSSAKVCQKCGKDQRNFFKKHPVITVILILLLIAIIASSSSNDNSSNTPTSTGNQTNSTNEEQIFNIGESISYNDYEITITSVTESSRVGSQYVNSKPADGGIYVCVDLSFKNISEEPLSSWKFPSVYLLDENGTKYSDDFSASSYYALEKDPDRKVLSDLNPGITTKDNKVFEISKDSYSQGKWYLLIDNKIKISVK